MYAMSPACIAAESFPMCCHAVSGDVPSCESSPTVWRTCYVVAMSSSGNGTAPLPASRIRQGATGSDILRFVPGLLRVRPPLGRTLPAASFGIALVAFQGGAPWASGLTEHAATDPLRPQLGTRYLQRDRR